jgi:DNA polymerase III alpha subunit
MFAPLHTKSEHSAGYGTASVDDLVRRAAASGYPALALTDMENLYGQVKFHHASRHWGVKPITGVELRSGYGPRTVGRKEGRLVLLARDRAGYESLCRIITRRRGAAEPQDDEPLRCLDAEPRGLFFLSDDAALLRELIRAGVSQADVRFLLVRPGGGPPPADVAAVADADVVMAEPGDRNLHVLLLAIRQRQTVTAVADAEPPQRGLPPPDNLRRLFQGAPETLAESLRVAEACSLDLSRQLPILPVLEYAAEETADARLEQICRQRLQEGRREGKWQGFVYDERLGQELAVLRRLAFGAYFLIVAEITDRARQQGIAVAGRGSAGGSLVAHVLGITPVDPIDHGLYFERFIHPQRKDLPDIDLDLPSDRREELIDWVFRRFGPEKVAMVSAHQTFGRRAAFREGLKALGLRSPTWTSSARGCPRMTWSRR